MYKFDFNNGSPPLASYFKRIVVLSDAERSIDWTGITRLLIDHNEWYFDTLGIKDGRGLVHLYDRQLHLNIDEVIEGQGTAAEKTLKKAQELSYAVVLALSTSSIEVNIDLVLHWIHKGLIQRLELIISEKNSNQESVVSSIQSLMETSVQIFFVGKHAQLDKMGILDTELINSRYFHLAQNESNATYSLSRPCGNRFSIVVDSVGDLYPCAALTGIEVARIGDLSTGFGDCTLASKTAPLPLEKLLLEGPSQQNITDINKGTTSKNHMIPFVCQLHRKELEKQSEANKR